MMERGRRAAAAPAHPRVSASAATRPMDRPARSDATRVRGRAALVDRFDAGRESHDVQDPDGGSGAVVVFTGVARADPFRPDTDTAGSSGERQVAALRFECYPEMALAELERIRTEAAGRFGLHGVTVVHRTGRIAAGEPIVLVAAAARHRSDAFKAAAWTMDQVKARVPIWKAEESSEGSLRWVTGEACRSGAP